jgi:hypothetical protein
MDSKMIFGIQMHHEEMQVKCCLIIIGEVIALGLRKHFLSDGWMDSKDVWYANVL